MRRVGMVIGGVLALALSGCSVQGDVEHREWDLAWTVTVTDIPAGASEVDIWIAVPQQLPEQRVTGLEVAGDWEWETVEDPDFGNRVVRISVTAPPESMSVDLSARVRRYPVVSPRPESLSHERNSLYLREETGVRGSPWLRVRADSLGKDHRKRYEHVLRTLDPGGCPGGGGGDGAGADYALLFMAYSRAVGVPAVFEAGVAALPGGESDRRGGYLCWTWVYRDGAWVPVDLLAADRDPARSDLHFGRLDADRITFSRGRDVRLPGMAGPPLEFLPPSAYVEVDGAPHRAVGRTLSYRPANGG